MDLLDANRAPSGSWVASGMSALHCGIPVFITACLAGSKALLRCGESVSRVFKKPLTLKVFSRCRQARSMAIFPPHS